MEMPNFAAEDIQKIEDLIKKRMPVGNQAPVDDIIQKFEQKHTRQLLEYAIHNMIRNGELEEVQGGRSIIRRKWTNDQSFFISDI